MSQQQLRRSSQRGPDFLGIGAQRAATTWLFECLDRHPDIFVPCEKEVHYFDEKYHRGWEWYATHFREADPNQIVGEITPNYLDVDAAADRIATDCPSAKLFVVLREPVSRAISSYELLGHRFAEKSFDEACRPGRYLVELGLYAKHLKRFFQRFDRKQIKVLLFDDVKKNPEYVLQELCVYLGVSPIQAPRTEKRVNTTVFPAAQRAIAAVGLTPVARVVRDSPLARPLRMLAERIRRMRSSNIDRKQIQAYFRDDILELETLIERDLSSWLM